MKRATYHEAPEGAQAIDYEAIAIEQRKLIKELTAALQAFVRHEANWESAVMDNARAALAKASSQ